MSHELRTPLNSLLILAEQLKDNPDNNMTDTQVQYASVISTSGKELMSLLNSILDLAKVESGTMEAELTELSVGDLRTALLNEFELVAQKKGLAYSIDLAPGSPETIVTDSQRLRQILKNLLANAFKFTEHGSVHVQIGVDRRRVEPGHRHAASPPSSVIAFAVTRHRHRHRRRTATADLRSLRPGRRHHCPALRRHRPRAVDQSGAGRACSAARSALTSTPGHGSTFTAASAGDGPTPRRRPVRLRVSVAAAPTIQLTGGDAISARAEGSTSPMTAVRDRRQSEMESTDKTSAVEDPGRRRRLSQHLRSVGSARTWERRGPGG